MGVEKFSPEIRQRFLGAGLSRAPVDLQVYNEVKIILSNFSENLPSLSVCLGGSLHCWHAHIELVLQHHPISAALQAMLMGPSSKAKNNAPARALSQAQGDWSI